MVAKGMIRGFRMVSSHAWVGGTISGFVATLQTTEKAIPALSMD
jgi:hypothetical protein